MKKRRDKNKNSGFVILFAVTLAAILLSIALGVTNIAQKEIKFGTSTKDTTNAFAAADTGIECALLYDKSASNAFTGSASMNCAGSPITITPSGSPTNYWTFAVTGIGSGAQSCAKVTVDKSLSSKTTITSKGYNIGNASCDSANPNRIERQLQVSYSSGTSTGAVTWTNALGVSVNGNNLTKTAGTAWGNAGASSVQTISSGDGYMEFTTSAGGVNVMAGLSRGDADQNYADIDFAVALQGLPACGTFCTGDNFMVFESGVCKYGNPALGCTVSATNNYTPGDIFKIAIESGIVTYYKNGSAFYTSAVSPAYPIVADTALYETGSTIINAVIFGN